MMYFIMQESGTRREKEIQSFIKHCRTDANMCVIYFYVLKKKTNQIYV